MSLIVGIILIILVAAGTGLKIWYFDRFSRAADSAEMTSIRELTIQAVKQTKTEAVRDPKTGDFYFPEAKLFLPNQNVDSLTYDVSLTNNATELSVSTEAVVNRAVAKLYGAQNIQEMFKVLPHLQACQRGMKLVYTPLTTAEQDNNELVQTVTLGNGKTLYIYLEKGCPELRSTADALKNLRAY